MKYLPYPRYKPSGVEWLGDVPEHWEVNRLKHVANMQAGKGVTSIIIDMEGKYPVYGGNGLRGYTSVFTHDGDSILIGRQGALCGNINYAEGRFWASEHAVVVTPFNNNDVHWLGELLRSMDLNQYSLAAAQPGLAVDDIKALRIACPPREEQLIISDFLVSKTSQIDRLITKKRELIERLKEKRTALISRTVTRGLPPEAARAAGFDPDPPLKDSGVEWLGEFPGHWDIVKFSREIRIQEGQVDPTESEYSQMVLVAPNHIESGTGRLVASESAADQAAESGKYWCSAGSVIYSKIRPALRKATVAPTDCLCSADMYPLNGAPRFSNEFLLWFILSSQYSAWSVLESDRVAMPKINRETLRELRLPAPPLKEQQAIASYLWRETAKLDHLIEVINDAVVGLKEYRIALITAAVTGKIDVRGVRPAGNAPADGASSPTDAETLSTLP